VRNTYTHVLNEEKEAKMISKRAESTSKRKKRKERKDRKEKQTIIDPIELSYHAHTHTHIYIHTYIYVYINTLYISTPITLLVSLVVTGLIALGTRKKGHNFCHSGAFL
jgi:hypothetical protein